MTEAVYRLVQLGRETTAGTSVAATTRFPIDPSNIELDRSSQFSNEDYGRSVRNHATRGYHGMRAASMPFACDVRFQDVFHLLEMHFAGSVTPSGTGPYTYVYPFEGGASTLKPYTVEEGVLGSTQDEWEMAGTLVDDLTLEFDALAAPGAQPWRASGTMVGFNRALAAMTAAQTTPATLETAMGHLTLIKEGPVATAFASLSELSGHLIRYSQTTNRNLVRRPYGGTSDTASAWGFSERAGGTFEALIKISASAKTNLHDIWTSSGGALGERRWRITIDGSGNNLINIDSRVAIFAVPVDERDGERVYSVTGEFVDDDTLTGPVAVTLVNDIAAVP